MSDSTDTFEKRNAIRQWTVERATLILDNTEQWYARMTDAACRAVMEGMGGGTLADYRLSYAGRSGGGYDRGEYERTVGVYVTDELEEMIEEANEGQQADSLLYMLLCDLLSLSDSAQADLFGEHYLPDPDDVETWCEENDVPTGDEDEDEDEDV